MARLARAEILDPTEIVAVHLIGKTVRSCYLMGVDEQSVPIISQTEVQEIETAHKSVVSPCSRHVLDQINPQSSPNSTG